MSGAEQVRWRVTEHVIRRIAMTTHATNRKSKPGGLLVAFCMLFSLATETSAVAQAKYSITDLGTLGGNNSIPYWITNTGDVIGVSDTDQFDSFGNPIDHAFRWSKGGMQDLGTLRDVERWPRRKRCRSDGRK
jgi:probable HAF family extracellular repeat protein